MGAAVGSLIGAVVGVFAPPIAAVCAVVGFWVGTAAEVINGVGKIRLPKKSGGGYHLDLIRDYHFCHVVGLALAKCNLMRSGLNRAATVGRWVLAPFTTALNGAKRLEHHWIIMKLDNGKYITSWKDKYGIWAQEHQSWNDCFKPQNCGAAKGRKKTGKVFKPKWDLYKNEDGPILLYFVLKAESIDDYYQLKYFDQNCQGYASKICSWYTDGVEFESDDELDQL